MTPTLWGRSAWLLEGRGPIGDGFGLAGLGEGFFVLIALLVLVLNVWATINVLRGRLAVPANVLWLVGIWFFVPLGSLVYILLRRTR